MTTIFFADEAFRLIFWFPQSVMMVLFKPAFPGSSASKRCDGSAYLFRVLARQISRLLWSHILGSERSKYDEISGNWFDGVDVSISLHQGIGS